MSVGILVPLPTFIPTARLIRYPPAAGFNSVNVVLPLTILTVAKTETWVASVALPNANVAVCNVTVPGCDLTNATWLHRLANVPVFVLLVDVIGIAYVNLLTALINWLPVLRVEFSEAA